MRFNISQFLIDLRLRIRSIESRRECLAQCHNSYRYGVRNQS